MNRAKALLSWTCVMLLAVCSSSLRSPSVYGQDAEKLREVRKEIQSKERALRRIKIQKSSVLEELEKLDKGVSFQNERLNKAQEQIREIQTAQKALVSEIKVLEASSYEQGALFQRRLVALYKMGRYGALPMLFSTDPFPVRLRNMNFVQILMQKDLEKIKAFHERLQEKVRKKAAFQTNMVEEKSWEDKYQTRLETLSAQRQKKAQWLFRIENERTLYEKLLAELQDSSRELEKLFLEKEKEKQRSRVERIGTPLIPGGSFKKQKGLLPWPVEGKVLREFGKQMDPKYNTLIVNDGIDIKVVPEQEIRAVFDGSVVYAGWFRGYGQLLIVDHGDDYCSVIAHADRLIKGTGDRVDVGEVLGYAGETGSLMGPAIHFEIRHNGQPVDPLSWIKAR